ncbi:hypothetical protein QZH41_012852, partial [Actinostola sp. cb2023]
CLGNRQSFKARQRERLAMSFESRRAAEERLRAKVQATQCQKKKDHTGTIKDINWDKEKLKQEVDGYEDGVKINWSDLARKYDIKNKSGNSAKNGGQIAQQYLVNEGVNVHRFKRQHDESNKENKIRRKKLRGLGGEISLPTQKPMKS